MGHEKVARLPFYKCPCYCINFCIYAMLRTGATFSWPTHTIYGQGTECYYQITWYRVGYKKVARLPFCKCPCYCINFCIYAILRTGVTFSWPTHTI